MKYFFYHISELMLQTINQRYDKIISFLIVLILNINLLNLSWIKMSIFEEYGAYKVSQY